MIRNSDCKRRGFIRWRTALVIVVVVAAVGLAYASMNRKPDVDAAIANLSLTKAQRGPLVVSITESGTIKPREQIILKNELDDATTLLYVVPEGSQVKQGDLLVELDVTTWEDLLVERRIRLQNSEAEMISGTENEAVVENQGMADIEQAELDFRFAKEDLQKYFDGEYPMQIMQLESEIKVATEELSQAKEDLEWSRRLFSEKYLSQSDLQQDELATSRSQINLELANEELKLFQDYTHKREMAQLESDVRQAELALERIRRKARANQAESKARLQAAKAEYEEDLARVRQLESQVVKSKITAPIDGVALYATSMRTGGFRQNEEPIGVGVTVYERDEIIYLPTTAAYNVEVKIPEVNLNKVFPGLRASVKVDALPGRSFIGTVASISPMPDAEQRWMNPNLKQYPTIIELEDGSDVLRNGMSCRAEIVISTYDDAVYVPIQTVTRVEGQTMVHLVEGGRITPRPIEIGFDNNVFVVVESGLTGGESILMEPPLAQGEDNAPQETILNGMGGGGGGRGRGGRGGGGGGMRGGGGGRGGERGAGRGARSEGRAGEAQGRGRGRESDEDEKREERQREAPEANPAADRNAEEESSGNGNAGNAERTSSLSRFEPRRIGGSRLSSGGGDSRNSQRGTGNNR